MNIRIDVFYAAAYYGRCAPIVIDASPWGALS